jgi:hypothetical protein
MRSLSYGKFYKPIIQGCENLGVSNSIIHGRAIEQTS